MKRKTTENNLSCGVDEAGRGPVIGSMVMGCVVLDAAGKKALGTLGVRDSKKLTPKKREYLEPLIKEAAVEWKILKITASEIDRERKVMSLNAIEADRIARMLTSLGRAPDVVYVDAADGIAENFAKRIRDFLAGSDFSGRIVAEHRADDTYIEASAASVLAKVARDREIEDIKKEYGEIGSGYPADPLTQRFLKRLLSAGELPPFVRRSWGTVDRGKQSSISDY